MVDLLTRLDVSNELNSQFQAHSVTCISRPCDSRNLNLNPLCMLENSPLPKLWTDRVKTITLLTLSLTAEYQVNETYEKAEHLIPSYIATLPTSMRKRHKDNLLVPKSKVRKVKEEGHSLCPGGVLQCLGGRHCSRQYLLWQGHRHG